MFLRGKKRIPDPGAVPQGRSAGLFSAHGQRRRRQVGSFCPHYDGEPQRRPSFQRMVLEGRLGDGLAADNGAAAHFVDGQLAQVVSSVPDARVYRVFRQGAQVCEMAFEARYLGAAGAQT